VAGNDPYDDEKARMGERDPVPQTGARPLLIGCLVLVLGGLAVIGAFVYFQMRPAPVPVEPDENWDRLVGTWELRDLAGRRCSFEFGADRSYRRVGFDAGSSKRIEESGRVVKIEARDAQPGSRDRVYTLEIEYSRREGGPNPATFTLDDSGQLRGPGVIGSYKKVK
jgi:hypothetical protein